jgi:hypothetical protein
MHSNKKDHEKIKMHLTIIAKNIYNKEYARHSGIPKLKYPKKRTATDPNVT